MILGFKYIFVVVLYKKINRNLVVYIHISINVHFLLKLVQLFITNIMIIIL